MTLWTASEAAAATGGAPQGGWEASGVAIDSRTIAAGDLFVAVAGPNHDGHCFVGQALEGGAAAAMVSRECGRDVPSLHVPDTRAGLYALARAARARSTARIAAITGSVGKTGCKDLLFHLLSRAGPAEASRGNLNNEWGAPLSLARLPREAAFAVFELGMNHTGEIAPLSRLVRPHAALVTAIAPAHTAFFASLSEVADAKAEIFAGLEPGGAAVLNADTPHIDRLEAAAERAGANVLRFSRRAGRCGVARCLPRCLRQRHRGGNPGPAVRVPAGRPRCALGAQCARRSAGAGGVRRRRRTPKSWPVSARPPAAAPAGIWAAGR